MQENSLLSQGLNPNASNNQQRDSCNSLNRFVYLLTFVLLCYVKVTIGIPSIKYEYSESISNILFALLIGFCTFANNNPMGCGIGLWLSKPIAGTKENIGCVYL